MTTYTTRADALARVHSALTASSYPRGVVLFILALSGGAAFLFSAVTLRLGVEQMGVRYLVATLVGYAAFLALIRVWIAYRRGFHTDPDPASDVAAEILGNMPGGGIPVRVGRPPDVAAFAGGRGGGGGSGASWGTSSTSVSDAPGIDFDELWPVVLAVTCAVGAVLAVFYVVYAAPLLLAEVALDAALLGGVYSKLRREDARHWLDSAFRRTWLAALAIGLLMMAAGFALQWAAPEARSIGTALADFSRG